MAKKQKLLLPYAYDSTGNLVHIDNAHKGEIYKCPECGKILSLNISKIPEGQKYHRRNHFSHHPEGSPDNQCTESFLHKLFKERAAECIRKKISNKETEFRFVWSCHECGERHQGNLLKKAKSVCLEYDLGVCRPDIALLDATGKVIIAIEVVVTHKPDSDTMTYYDDHKIACLQINVPDFEDCENVEKRLANPDWVNKCLTPDCKVCGRKMHKPKMIIINHPCWKCGKDMRIAMINDNNYCYSPDEFTEEDVRLANENGAYITMKYSNESKASYYANTCRHCEAFIGQFYMHEYYECIPEKVMDLDYKCYHCMEMEKQAKIDAEQEIQRKLNDRIMKDGIKICPECNGRLVLRKGKNGYFYGCRNFPKCHYTKNIILDD